MGLCTEEHLRSTPNILIVDSAGSSQYTLGGIGRIWLGLHPGSPV